MDGANYPRSFVLASSIVRHAEHGVVGGGFDVRFARDYCGSTVVLTALCEISRGCHRYDMDGRGRGNAKLYTLLLTRVSVKASFLRRLSPTCEGDCATVAEQFALTSRNLQHLCSPQHPAQERDAQFCSSRLLTVLSSIREIDRDRAPRSAPPPRCPSSAALAPLAKCAPLSSTSGALFIAQWTKLQKVAGRAPQKRRDARGPLHQHSPTSRLVECTIGGCALRRF